MPPCVRRACDGARMLHVDGQRLFHHHVDVPPGAGLHHHGMVEGAGERRHGFRLHAIEHGRQIRKENFVFESVLPRIHVLQRGIGIEHADDLNILAMLHGFKESVHVTVNQARNSEPQWCASYT